MHITYQEIDAAVEKAIIAQYGNWVKDYNCLVRGEGCCLAAALDGDIVAGFAALQPQQWIAPLDAWRDGFIEVIEVTPSYQRMGIGSHLIGMLETFAKAYGYCQIRAWSSDDKVEALQMWRKLQYCMCPAAMLGASVVTGDTRQIAGYYCVKSLK